MSEWAKRTGLLNMWHLSLDGIKETWRRWEEIRFEGGLLFLSIVNWETGEVLFCAGWSWGTQFSRNPL